MEVQKYCRDRLGFSEHDRPAHERGGGTGGRTKFALVRRPGVLMPGPGGVLFDGGVVGCSDVLLMHLDFYRLMGAVVVRGHLSFNLDPRTWP